MNNIIDKNTYAARHERNKDLPYLERQKEEIEFYTNLGTQARIANEQRRIANERRRYWSSAA
ncbi:MAG: hypothetical protein ACR2IS_09065 [Nitrososphaeraceae archaeon]